MKKRILSIILSLVLCLGTVAATIPIGAETNDTMTMTALNAAGSVSQGVSKITISDAEELEALSAYTKNGGATENLTFVLTNNIVLNPGNASDWANGENLPTASWTPIGSVNNNPFKGTFDGQGHIISGVYINATADNAGLFADVAKGGIKNVAITNSYIYSSKNNVGGLVGKVRAYDVKIENVYVDANIETVLVDTGINVGGIVGSVLNDSGYKTTIENCVFAGTVSGRAYVGGIIGEMNWSNGTHEITNCANFGSVTGVAHSVSGIVGRAKHVTMSNCLNAGSVYGQYASGFAGRVQGAVSTFSNSYSCTDVISYPTEQVPVGSYYGWNGDNLAITVDETCGMTTTSAIKGAAASSVLENLDWTAWTTTLSYPMPKTVAEMLYTPNAVYAQATKAEDDGTYSVRFLVVVDTLDYDATAFTVKATYDSGTKDFFKNVDTAYTSVIACGETVSATELGGKYLLAYAITGIDIDTPITFEVTVTTNSGVVQKEITRTFSDITAEEGE